MRALATRIDGPVAVIGAHGESYAAMGQLALDGMLRCLMTPEPPTRLGAYWLAAKAGLARGKIDGITFWLYDQADGSRGTVPLDEQRERRSGSDELPRACARLHDHRIR